MMKNDIKNIPLPFINTPLQNLRNILFEVDTSLKKKSTPTPGLNLEWTIPSDVRGVSKLELLKIVSELKMTSGQYVTRADIGAIFLSTCKNSEKNVSSVSIRALEELINS